MKTQDSTRRHFSLLAAAALAAAAFGLPGAALAQAKFPSKPVTIVVPYTAGGASDVQARLIGQKLSQLWGQPVVVDNKPGASASIGMQFVAQAAPDGHTLVISDLGTLTIAPSVRKVPYELDKDFAPLTILTYSPYLLTAHPSTPYNTLNELVVTPRPTRTRSTTAPAAWAPTPTWRGASSHRAWLQWTDAEQRRLADHPGRDAGRRRPPVQQRVQHGSHEGRR